MDAPEWLILPIFSGFSAYLFFKRNEDSVVQNDSSIILSALIGIFFGLPFLFLQNFLTQFSFFEAPAFVSEDTVKTFNLAIGATSSFIFGWLFFKNKKWVQHFFQKPKTVDDLIEEEALWGITENNARIDKDPNATLISFMIELKNEKVYIGIITSVDLISPTGCIKILPIKSGSRSSYKIDFSNDYESQNSLNYHPLDLPPQIIIPKSEIITLREFSPEYHAFFNNIEIK